MTIMNEDILHDEELATTTPTNEENFDEILEELNEDIHKEEELVAAKASEKKSASKTPKATKAKAVSEDVLPEEELVATADTEEIIAVKAPKEAKAKPEGAALTFKDFNLPEELMRTLEQMQYTTPTPIQAQTIPLALNDKRDILGSAQTGTGKTAAFGIPLISQLLTSETGSALILLPTRELAMQVLNVLKQMSRGQKGIRTALLIGGDPYPGQLRDLRDKPRLIVGTPGRINDHLARGTLKLSDTRFLVLDETDRMLDMGFGIQLDAILEYLPEKRQTLMFSATLPNEIVKLSSKYLNNPARIAVGNTNKPALNIKQETARVADGDKYDLLLKELEVREGSIVIFVKTKRSADKIAGKLRDEDHKADCIHGDLRQTRRERNIRDFRNRKFRILIATDVAARGLDIDHIRHVINYDLPQCADDFIHRIGRTARNGAEGCALSFISKPDESKWRAIARMLDPNSSDNDRNSRDDAPHLKRRNSGSFDKWGNRSSGGGSNGGGRPRSGGGRSDDSRGAPKRFGDSRPASRDRFADDSRPSRRFDDSRPAPRDRFADDSRPARRTDDSRPAPRGRFSDDSRPARRNDDSRPAPRGRFSDDSRPARRTDDSRPAQRDRFADDARPSRRFDDSRPAPRDRFADDSRPAPRGRFSDDSRPAPRRTDDSRPAPRGRFSDDSRPAPRDRFSDDSRPTSRDRFSDDSRPASRDRFADKRPTLGAKSDQGDRPFSRPRPTGNSSPNQKAFQKRSNLRFKPNAF